MNCKIKKEIGEITEAQQLKLFELTYKHYLKYTVRFYNKYKNKDSVPWEKLHPILKDVFDDVKYQGVLSYNMVPIFGNNRKMMLFT